MIINMVGGGGGFSASNAILGVTAYAGSVVTISNGTVTKTVTPDRSHLLSNLNDWAIYYFGIPSGMFSSSIPWSIVATYQTEQTTGTIIIDTNAFYDVELTYVVPYDYQQVEYLESNGNQYINTLINTDNIGFINTSFMTLGDGQSHSRNYIFGGTNSNKDTTNVNGGFGLLHLRSGTNIAFRYRTSSETTVAYFPGNYSTVYDCELSFMTNNKYCTINNTTRSLSNAQTITFNGALYLFTMHFGDGVSLETNTNRIYNFFKIFDYNNQMVANLIPCYRKIDSVAGMYDNVNKIFLTNQGTGTFVVGSDVTS